MATVPSSTAKALTLHSSSVFVQSCSSYSALCPQSPPPLPLALLSRGSPLPPIPPDFPRCKLIPRTRFIVDGFRSAGDFSVSYFLSHFHSDHYAGLSPSWSRGIIFCSEATSRLLVEILKVPPVFVVSLSLGDTVRIDGCDVTVVDANHCPGAVQFLFEVPGTVHQAPGRYVHTGDFRFCESMKSDRNLCRFVGADAIFLDTTYCNPKFVFPCQEESVDYVVNTIKRIRTQHESSSQSILFLIATYVVGKEKILLEISCRCNCSLHVDSRKMEILSILGFGESGAFTEDASSSNVHVIGWNLLGETWPYFRPNFMKMKEIMMERGYSKAVGFVSTGWMYETKKDGFAVRMKDSLEIHLVPYSEHSSYDELREYVRFLRPKRVIPFGGVNVEKLDGKHALALQKHFRGLVDETANKQEFLMAFHQKYGVADMKALGAMNLSMSQQEDIDEKDDPPGQQPCLQDSNMLNDEALDGARNDLHECLPSWVTDDQIVSLLRSSGGDIVEAISDFFERELELYEQANAGNLVVSSSQPSLLHESASDPGEKPTLENPDTTAASILDQERKSANRHPDLLSIASPKRLGFGVGNRPKKKGRSSSTIESCGCKQSTITKYFVKAPSSASKIDECGAISTTDQQLKDGMQILMDPIEMYKQELDQFIQIINGGLPRKAAASLLEKAKGSIGVAVDLYYSNSSYASINEETTSSALIDMGGDLVSSNRNKVVKFSE